MEYKTIDNRWDILYRDYPEIYDEFAAVPKTPGLFPKYAKLFNFKDKMILDIASGSGLSSFEMRPYCKSIIGIEPEDAMRDLAEKNAKEKNFTDIAFKKGKADNVPLPDNSVDISVAITLSIFDPKEIRSYVKEQMRVVKKGGLVVKMDIAPGWYGGDLAPVILGKERWVKDSVEMVINRVMRKECSFKYIDVYQDQEYGSVDKICRTYGFIFGRKAIDYLLKKKKTKIRWKGRVYYKKV